MKITLNKNGTNILYVIKKLGKYYYPFMGDKYGNLWGLGTGYITINDAIKAINNQ